MVEDTKVKDVYSKGFEALNENEPVSKTLPILENSEPPVVIVENDDGEISGVLTRRRIRRSKLDPTSTKIKKLKQPAPYLRIHDSVSETARLMLENQVLQLPVYAGEKLVGVISYEDVIDAAAGSEWGEKEVQSVMTSDPFTVSPEETISQVLSLFRMQGFSHAPVVERGDLQGIVSIQDIMDIVYHAEDRSTRGDRAGNKEPLSNMEIRTVMSAPVYAARPDETLQEAAQKMRDHDISSLVVIEDERVTGIVTKKDFLEPISQAGQKRPPMQIQFSVKPGIRMTEEEKAIMRKEFDSFARRYQEALGLGNLFVYMKKYGAVSKGDQLIHCRLQFRTSRGPYYGTAEGWSPEEAFRLALTRLERQIIQSKETELSEEHSRRQIEEYLESEL
ncbi:MAG: CBS domain-containing protein [Candidatus Lokiarchaeota archaeon]|nr:CBS domain-containing protein [Candidatus Lokiarchaeota archaeon]